MHRSEFSAAIVARPSGWLTSTFRMAICRDTYNSTPQLETVSNVVVPGWAVYGPVKFSQGNAGQPAMRMGATSSGYMTLRCQIEIVVSAPFFERAAQQGAT
jgi:hypothetical protein